MFKLINHYLINLSKMNELNDFPFGGSNDMIRYILNDLPINVYLQRIILNYSKVEMNFNIRGHLNEIKKILFGKEHNLNSEELNYLDLFLEENNKNSNIELWSEYLEMIGLKSHIKLEDRKDIYSEEKISNINNINQYIIKPQLNVIKLFERHVLNFKNIFKGKYIEIFGDKKLIINNYQDIYNIIIDSNFLSPLPLYLDQDNFDQNNVEFSIINNTDKKQPMSMKFITNELTNGQLEEIILSDEQIKLNNMPIESYIYYNKNYYLYIKSNNGSHHYRHIDKITL